MLKRADFEIILKRLQEKRHFIQALVGPRQVGKTTLALQVIKALACPSHYASADESSLNQESWLEQQWEIARLELNEKNRSAVLIIDEIQKIPQWSTTVKRLWDEDTRAKRELKVLILGSAPLLIQKGLHESLAGRFEVLPIRHWTYSEMATEFKWDFNQFIYFGAYPGAAALIEDENRWKNYIRDSLIETTISKDILSLAPIQKPALLKQLFHLGCLYSGQILSYQKMTGQLQDAGNTTTLAHYLDLLSASGLLSGLQKYSGQALRQRGSSPKLLVQNTALLSANAIYTFQSAQQDRTFWGRLLESAIGAYLFNQLFGNNIQLFYWRDGDKEVDYVLQSGKKIVAIEVKSGSAKETLSGMDEFKKRFNPGRVLLVGGQGISPETFLKTPVTHWFE